MFRLHALLVDVSRKVRCFRNRIVISKERDGYHLQKDASFDILSLANQLHKSKSIYPESLEQGKIYFLKNQVSNLIKLGLEHLPKIVRTDKEVIRKDFVYVEEKALSRDIAKNKTVEELFRQA